MPPWDWLQDQGQGHCLVEDGDACGSATVLPTQFPLGRILVHQFVPLPLLGCAGLGVLPTPLACAEGLETLRLGGDCHTLFSASLSVCGQGP